VENNDCDCEECREVETGGSLRDQIWANQLQHREIWINGEINDSIIEKLVVQLHNLNQEDDEREAHLNDYVRDEIKVFINSAGGDLHSGMAAVSAIKASRSPVHTIALGKAFSMGFLMLIAGHKRSCQEFSTLMYHQLSAGIGLKSLRDIEQVAEQCGCQQAMIEELVKEHTLLPEEELDRIFVSKHDLYLNAAEALEWGVVDTLI
jgi:ATP-dependent Clp protease protease subunit